MKCLILLILICSMIGIPVNAVNLEIPVAVNVSSKENEPLMKGYLERELRQLDGIKVVSYTESEWQDAKWVIHIIASRLNDGYYIAGITVVRIRYIEPYLKTTLKNDLRENLAFIPEHHQSLIATGYDLKELCERIIVGVEEMIRN